MYQKWKREETELLITTMQQYPCLYNIHCIEYLDRTKKALAFNNVLKIMQNSRSTISLYDIKQRWRNIRTQYVQELRTMQKSKINGCGKSDVYVPKLWCYNQLSFLETNTKMRHSEDNINENDENSVINDKTGGEDEIYIEDSPQQQQLEDSYIEAPSQKTKRVINVVEIRSDLANLKRKLVERKREKKFAWLGKLVATQIEALDVEEQEDAAWQIQCLMRKLTSEQKHDSRTNSSYSKDMLELSMAGVFERNQETIKTEAVQQNENQNVNVKIEQSNMEFEDANINDNANDNTTYDDTVDATNPAKRSRISTIHDETNNTFTILHMPREPCNTLEQDTNSKQSPLMPHPQPPEPFKAYRDVTITNNTNSAHDIDDELEEINDENLINIEKKLDGIKNLMPRSKESKQLLDELSKAETEYYRSKTAYFTKLTENCKIKRTLMLLQSRNLQLEYERLTNES